MLRGTGEYRIERWFANGVPLVSVRPAGSSRPSPVVVIYHRFSGRNTDDLLRLALPLADSGVAAVLPEAALHGERAPQNFDRRLCEDRDALFTDVLDDTVDEADEVLAWVSSHEELDPSRIGVVGTSMGGAVALAVACGGHSPAPKVAVALMPTTPMRAASSSSRPATQASTPSASRTVASSTSVKRVSWSSARRLSKSWGARSPWRAASGRMAAMPESARGRARRNRSSVLRPEKRW